jgi:protocatechuate 3,4-dioxygenase beta subunit
MTVAGRVLDPDGKPVKGAVVDLVARPRSPWVGASDEIDPRTSLGQGQSDGDGRFRLDAPRTASIRVFEVHALATAPGYGLGWAELNPDAEQPAAEIRLQPEQVVRARLVDVTGAPVRGVEVRVWST